MVGRLVGNDAQGGESGQALRTILSLGAPRSKRPRYPAAVTPQSADRIKPSSMHSTRPPPAGQSRGQQLCHRRLRCAQHQSGGSGGGAEHRQLVEPLLTSSGAQSQHCSYLQFLGSRLRDQAIRLLPANHPPPVIQRIALSLCVLGPTPAADSRGVDRAEVVAPVNHSPQPPISCQLETTKRAVGMFSLRP